MEGYNQLTCIMALGCRRHIKTNFWLDGSLIHSQEVGMKYIHHKLRIWLHGLNVLWYKYHIFIYPSFLVLHALLRLIFLTYSVRYWLLIFFATYLSKSCSIISNMLLYWQKMSARCWETADKHATPSPSSLLGESPMLQSNKSCLQWGILVWIIIKLYHLNTYSSFHHTNNISIKQSSRL